AGGLRVVQADALSYSFVRSVYAALIVGDGPTVKPLPRDDEWNIQHQVAALHALASLPDVAEFAGVAHTPEEARRLVAAGKLALVPGVEAETLGDIDRTVSELQDPRQIREALQSALQCLYEQGVRHVIPVHLGENALGAPAAYDVMFDLGNHGSLG